MVQNHLVLDFKPTSEALTTLWWFFSPLTSGFWTKQIGNMLLFFPKKTTSRGVQVHLPLWRHILGRPILWRLRGTFGTKSRKRAVPFWRRRLWSFQKREKIHTIMGKKVVFCDGLYLWVYILELEIYWPSERYHWQMGRFSQGRRSALEAWLSWPSRFSPDDLSC